MELSSANTCGRPAGPSSWLGILLVLIGLAAPSAAEAQAIRGTVYQLEDGRLLGNVLIRVAGGNGFEATAITDSTGRFTVIVPGRGRYLVAAERMGLQPFNPAPVEVPFRAAVEVTLTMSSEAVQLEGLVVVAIRQDWSMTAMVNERIRSARALGLGRTMTLEEIQTRAAPHTAALVATAAPGVRISSREIPRVDADVLLLHNCVPAVYVDGIRINHRPTNVNYIVAPDQLLAVEVYRGTSQMRDYFDSSGCGTILLWTKRGGEQQPGRVSWKRVGIAVLVVSGLLILR